jgi:serine/threonine protein kinase
MSRVLQQDIEGKTRSGVGPICWMSPESIGQQVYSKKSDVWMFGLLFMKLFLNVNLTLTLIQIKL